MDVLTGHLMRLAPPMGVGADAGQKGRGGESSLNANDEQRTRAEHAPNIDARLRLALYVATDVK
jgi:hypothetical protein